MKPRISVVIPCYRTDRMEGVYAGTLGPWFGAEAPGREGRAGLQRLRLCLGSLEAQTLPPEEFEVVVVDDGSPRDLSREIEAWDLSVPVRVVRQQHAGVAHAFNRGIAEAAGELVFLTVDHELLGPRTLEAHVGAHARTGSDREVVCGRQLLLLHSALFRDITRAEVDPADLDAIAGQRGFEWMRVAAEQLELDKKPVTLDDVRGNFPKIEVLASQTREYRDVESVLRKGGVEDLPCGWLVMRVGNESAPRSLLERVGGFDETLDQHGGWYIDSELGFRLHRAGAQFGFAEDAVAIDLFHGGSRSDLAGKATGLAYLVSRYGVVEIALLAHYLDRVVGIEEYGEHVRSAEKWWQLRVGS